jgi:hypothetical protein
MEAVSDVTTEIAPDVPEEVPAEVPGEVPDVPDLQTVQARRPPRVRKVRVKEPPPPPKANHVYWGDRLQEHRATQRLAKNERYGNLRIM